MLALSLGLSVDDDGAVVKAKGQVVGVGARGGSDAGAGLAVEDRLLEDVDRVLEVGGGRVAPGVDVAVDGAGEGPAVEPHGVVAMAAEAYPIDGVARAVKDRNAPENKIRSGSTKIIHNLSKSPGAARRQSIRRVGGLTGNKMYTLPSVEGGKEPAVGAGHDASDHSIISIGAYGKALTRQQRGG